jgi:signal transduction histidine kinase
MSAALQPPQPMQPTQPNRSIRGSRLATPARKPVAAARHLAHDIRNWLTVLQVYCDLLRSSDAVAGKERMWIEELSHAVEQGKCLVNSLLDSAEASAAQPSSPLWAVPGKALDLGKALQRRLPLFREIAGSTIHVEARSVADAGTTALQEPELDRILLNLVRNAIDAMPHGGKLTLELERGRRPERSCLVLKVSDSGQGIPADLLAHIFDSGFSTKASLRHANSQRGFGLAIVRELTLRAGGSVRVRSRIGHGTCFILELPLLTMSPASQPHTPTTQPRELGALSQMPQPKPGGTVRRGNFGSHRKGIRVPC